MSKETLIATLNLDNTISINRVLAHKIGLNASVIYQALIAKYCWYEKNGKLDDEGYFYSSLSDLQESTTLKRSAQDKAIKELVKLDYIKTKVKGLPATRYFNINFDEKVLKSIFEKEERQEEQSSMSENDKLDTTKDELVEKTNCEEGDNVREASKVANMSKNDKLDCIIETNKYDEKKHENLRYKTKDIINHIKSNHITRSEIQNEFDKIKNAINYDAFSDEPLVVRTLLDDIVNAVVYEVYCVADETQINLGTKTAPVYKSVLVLRDIFDKNLNSSIIITYMNQLYKNGKQVTNVSTYHLKSLYRQCLGQSTQTQSKYNYYHD